MKTTNGLFAIVLAASSLLEGVAAAADPVDVFRARAQQSGAEPSLGLAIMGGLSLPTCEGQIEGCSRAISAAPSLRGWVLYQPTPTWALGVVGQISSVHWAATYLSFGSTTGARERVESTLTTGFAGVGARFTPAPTWRVTPIVEAALGAAFQAQSGSNFGCNGGAAPTALLGVGAGARLARSVSLSVTASGMTGFRSTECLAFDGAPATPFAAWGYGLHAGLQFDLGLVAPQPARATAQR